MRANVPRNGGHNRVDISSSGRPSAFEEFDYSGADVVVVFWDGCHLRHGDSLVLMVDPVRAPSQFPDRTDAD